MKYSVLYTSKTGFTKKICGLDSGRSWSAALCPRKNAKKSIIDDAECIITGGWIKAGRIQGLGKLKNSRRQRKKICGICSRRCRSDMKDVIDKMWLQNFTEEELSDTVHFYFEGGLDYAKMGFVNRSMMNMMKKMLSKDKASQGEDDWMIERIKSDFLIIRIKGSTAAFVDLVKEMQQC